MALPKTDTFTAADGTELSTYNASYVYNNSGYTSQTFRINTNAVHPYNGGVAAEVAAHWEGDAFNDDQYSKGTIVAIASGAYIGLCVRAIGGSTRTFYDYISDSADGSYVGKYVSGSYTQLGSAGAVFTTSLAIELQASGETITPIRAGGTADIGAQSDSSVTSGYAGLACYGSNTGSRIDNWEGGDIGGSATNLTVVDAYVTSQTDAVSLTYSKTLSVNDASVTSQADAASLTKSDTLAPADVYVTTQTDAIELSTTTTTDLTVQDAAAVTQTDAVSLTKSDTLTPDDASVTTQTDAVSLTKSDTLAVDDASVTAQADPATLTKSDTLAVDDTSVTSQTDALTLTKSDTLSILDAYVITQTDAIELSTTTTTDLTVQDAAAVTQTDAVSLTKSDTLTPDDASSGLRYPRQARSTLGEWDVPLEGLVRKRKGSW